ncbi:hypothetical protein LC593_29570 [Nostoc sp. CHAB 5844]|nr:hypothetical protein [Nostoc sp. CHAB 5844]
MMMTLIPLPPAAKAGAGLANVKRVLEKRQAIAKPSTRLYFPKNEIIAVRLNKLFEQVLAVSY